VYSQSVEIVKEYDYDVILTLFNWLDLKNLNDKNVLKIKRNVFECLI